MKDIARLIHMVGKLSELPEGGQGLYVAVNRVMAKLQMQALVEELSRHEIPHRVLRNDMTVDIWILRVKILFMPIDSLEHRAQGLELDLLVDDATCAMKMSESHWHVMNVVRSRVRH